MLREKNVSISLWKSFSEVFKGIIPIRIFGQEKKMENIVNTKIEEMLKISIKQNELEKINYFVASSLFMISIGIILIVSAIMVSKSMISIGSMVAILMYNHMITDPLIEILETKQASVSVQISLDRLSSIFKLPDDINNKILRSKVDCISLNDICFAYYNEQEDFILKNINLKLSMNEKIAIFGETGSGKSTLVKLIAGLLNASQGSIEYFYKGVKVDYLPSLSYLYQNSYLFDQSIIDNIKFSNQKVSDEFLASIIKRCKIDEIIKVHGESSIGEDGIRLSGGEKTRIRLAMMLLKNDASIFIFDELSSSLDNSTINEIFSNIVDLLDDKICIFIEHNEFILEYVDKKAFMKQGRLNIEENYQKERNN